uniref:Uncharacterized protein n=1 Tax=Ditylenchus dipsaci TaxID=166011 RepID=A0A915ESS1_9BILA
MLLSDIREESDEAEEMSTREDEEDEEEEQDSLSGHPSSAQNLQQEHLDALGYDAMLSSVDSLDVARHVAAAAGHGMDTSVDSLEAGSLPRHARDQLDESGAPTSHMEVSSQDTGLSAGTDTTFQEEYEDDKDSLDGIVRAYPTTLTTFETVQMREDGSTETITRRVITQVTDPVHSRVRFTGTESEDQLRNIQEQQPIESVDEEGNITTTIRRQTIH